MMPHRLVPIAALLLGVAPSGVRAQEIVPAPPAAATGLAPVVPDARLVASFATPAAAVAASADVAQATSAQATGAQAPLFSRRDLAYWGVALAGGAILYQFDERISASFPDKADPEDGGAAYAARRIAPFNEVKAAYGTAGLYVVGLALQNHRVAEVGLHTAEAWILAKGAMEVAGGLAGRARPVTAIDNGRRPDAGDWELNRGWSTVGYHAWPSRHVTGVSAVTTALALEVREHWPRQSKWVTPIAIALPVAVGLGRMYTQHHWATDVWAGMAFGAYTGWKTVHYNHRHPNSWMERVLLPD